MSHLTDIASYLQSNGITDSIFYDHLDDSYPECIAISDYSGSNVYETVSEETEDPDPDCPNINIIVRKHDSEDCFNVAWTIYKLLKKHSNKQIGSTFFRELQAKGPPSLLGKTKNEYFQRTINFSTKIYQVI